MWLYTTPPQTMFDDRLTLGMTRSLLNMIRFDFNMTGLTVNMIICPLNKIRFVLNILMNLSQI